jgi:peptidoglycan/LPS O-acetylase OafA/YrhL
MENSRNTTGVDIKPLTSLRFFAAAGVIYGHFGYAYNTAGLGVSFFFMLSGFILTHSYYQNFNSFKFSKIKSLWISRAARIYPLHLITLLVSIPLAFHEGGSIGIPALIENATLLQAWYPNHIQVFSFNSVSWTLSNEIFFYLVLPIILLLTNKLEMHKKLYTSGVLLVLCILFTAFIMNKFKPIPYSIPFSWRWWLILVSPYLNLFTFLSGVFLSFIHHNIKDSKLIASRFRASICEISVIIISTAYFLLTLENMIFSSIFFMYGLPLALLILIFSLQRGIISKFLSLKPIVYLGEISFSIYMVHQIVIRGVEDYVGKVVVVSSSPEDVINKILVTALIILVASFTYHSIENPARNAIKKLASS